MSLRERKKAKTRTAIQRHAIRLFQQQGYDATTIEQIAEAAEVAPSTFFRYFPTKEDVVLWDEFDTLFVEAFRAQPSETTPLQAMHGAFLEVFASLADNRRRDERVRIELALTHPALRGAVFAQIAETAPMLAQLLAERSGCAVDDPAVRIVAGVVIGVALSVGMAAATDPTIDWVEMLGEAFLLFKQGFPL
jgi:AcrR family transcriptional regulator